MEPAFVSQFLKHEVPRGTAGWVNSTEVMAFINATLAKGPYLLGEKFSAVDILMGTTFALFLGSPLLAKTDLLEAYVKRVLDRPAYARAQKREQG
jgi:glutathione S-transferase